MIFEIVSRYFRPWENHVIPGSGKTCVACLFHSRSVQALAAMRYITYKQQILGEWLLMNTE